MRIALILGTFEFEVFPAKCVKDAISEIYCNAIMTSTPMGRVFTSFSKSKQIGLTEG